MGQKTIKLRLYPTKEQRKLLAQMHGNVRFVYNKTLSASQELYLVDKKYWGKYNLYQNVPVLKRLYPFLAANSVMQLRAAIDNLDRAYQGFFSGLRDFPKFKKRSNTQSLICTQSVKIVGNKLSVEFLKDIPLNFDKRCEDGLPEGITRATITKTPTGKYYASLSFKTADVAMMKSTGVEGQDQGLKDLIVTDFGKKIKPRKSLQKNALRLKRSQRSLSRKKKGSNRRKRQKRVVARNHEKVAAERKFHLDLTVSNSVKRAIRNNHAIAIQKLNVKGMVGNRHLAKTVSDAGMGYYFSKLKEKAASNGVTVVEIDQWQPTSKLCHKCQAKNETLTLKDRKWKCSGCGTLHDRDVNAAKVCKAMGEIVLGLEKNGEGSSLCARVVVGNQAARSNSEETETGATSNGTLSLMEITSETREAFRRVVLARHRTPMKRESSNRGTIGGNAGLKVGEIESSDSN